MLPAPEFDNWTSTGGFSNIFARPSYQNPAVSSYISNYSYYKTNNSHYNVTGRGLPDVSAVGQNFSIIYEGRYDPSYGTSISTPIWASIITLINQRRQAANKSSVGFVHPVLYAHPEAFNDVRSSFSSLCALRILPLVNFAGSSDVFGRAATNVTAA